MMSHKFYHESTTNSGCHDNKIWDQKGYITQLVWGNITEMLAPSRAFWQLMDVPCIAPSRVTQLIFAALVEWYHHIVLTMNFKLVSFFFICNDAKKRVGVNGPPIGNHQLRVLWSRDRWRDLTQNVVTFVPLLTNEVSQCYRKNVLLQNRLTAMGQIPRSIERISSKIMVPSLTFYDLPFLQNEVPNAPARTNFATRAANWRIW